MAHNRNLGAIGSVRQHTSASLPNLGKFFLSDGKELTLADAISKEDYTLGQTPARSSILLKTFFNNRREIGNHLQKDKL